jgi:D-alanyl-D-alanine dipeptidase
VKSSEDAQASVIIFTVTRTFRSLLSLTLLTCYSLLASAQPAKTATPATKSFATDPKPTDVSPEWKRLVGIYRHEQEQVVILERNQRLFWRLSHSTELPVDAASDIPIHINSLGSFELARSGLSDIAISLQRDENESVKAISIGGKAFLRVDAGSDPVHFYHVTPARPVSELREKALKLSPPVEQGPFRKPDLVELMTLDPLIHLDIRYADTNNFLSTPVYTEARAFMQRPAAEALLHVLHKLQPLGYGLLIHDAYRPWYVTKIFWDATPPEGKIFVADPQKGSKHNRGCAVDLTLYELASGQAVEMPGLYDEMSPRSFPNFPGGTSLQRWHRDLLRRAMESEGFAVNEDEWWHFDYKDWKQYGILNVPFEKITVGRQPAAVSR